MPFSIRLVLPIWMDYSTTCQQPRRLRDTSYAIWQYVLYISYIPSVLSKHKDFVYVYIYIHIIYLLYAIYIRLYVYIILSYHSLGRVTPLMSPQIGTPKLRKVAHPSPVGTVTHPSRTTNIHLSERTGILGNRGELTKSLPRYDI